MARKITLKSTGKTITIFNPQERSEKYALDLKYGVDTVTGKKLTNRQKAWRSGYLKARKDNARVWKAKVKLKKYWNKQRQYEEIFK